MALNSLVKNFADRLSFLSDFCFNYQKTRVIGSLRYLDEILDARVEGPFFERPDKGSYFYVPRPADDHTYKRENIYREEAMWLATVVESWDFDTSRLSKYEALDYKEASEKLALYAQVTDFTDTIQNYILAIVRITSIRRQVLLRGVNYPQYEKDIINKFHEISKTLEEFPEWKAKFLKEVEPKIKFMFDTTKVLAEQQVDNQWRNLAPQKFFKCLGRS